MFLKKILRPKVFLWLFIALYAFYFSYLTVLRYHTLYASYFDLGIMHQAVHNSYKAIQKNDYSHFLEITDPLGKEQIKRMGVHNDLLLGLLAPFYFFKDSPAMLLVIQAVVVSLGAFAVFLITSVVFNKSKYKELLSLAFALSYLLNPVLQKANIYDFHAVVLATTTLLFTFYFYLRKNYLSSFIFLLLSLMAKEQVSLTAAFFALYILYDQFKEKKSLKFPITVLITSLIWFCASVFWIIPHFRGGDHFAVARYSDFGDSPGAILLGFFKNPQVVLQRVFHTDTFRYFLFLLGPLGFLSVFALPIFLISLPELGVNLLSENWNMRNIIYHYTAVIQPFIFISAIYGAKKLIDYSSSVIEKNRSRQARIVNKITIIAMVYILIATAIFSYWKSPLPYSLEKEIHPIKYPQAEMSDAKLWGDLLKKEDLKISSTGQLSPFFSGRRYFYTFDEDYVLADYIAIRLNEIYNYPEKDTLIPVYQRLVKDPDFELIYQKKNFEVYKKKKP